MVAHTFKVLGRQRQADLCEFKASLFYTESSRTARATQSNPVSKKKNKNKTRAKIHFFIKKTIRTLYKLGYEVLMIWGLFLLPVPPFLYL